MFWGGLKPIRSRLYLDLVELVVSGYCVIIRSNKPHFADVLLISVCFLTFKTSGLTKRWTISFPLILITLLHILHKLSYQELTKASEANSFSEIATSVNGGVSLLLIGLSTVLCILFPAVEISHPEGEPIAIVDIHLPVQFDDEKVHGVTKGFVSVRLMYPTLDHVESVPSFNTDTSKQICRALMQVGAPPPLNKLTWMLDTWQLSRIKAKRDGEPSNKIGKMPIVVFSHGLTGNVALYSYQALSLASKGHLVAIVDHSDGSAIGMKKQDGSFLHYDSSIGEIERKCNNAYVRTRRKQTDYRAKELYAVTLALKQLNEINYSGLENKGISFINKLDISKIAVGGHSFGAVTAVTTAARNPEIYYCVIAHDPALDWLPDDARKAMFEETRLKESMVNYDGGTGGYEKDSCNNNLVKEEQKTNLVSNYKKLSIHDLDLLFLYSHEWVQKGWGGSRHIFYLYRHGQLGPKKYNCSECLYIHNAHHSEFSDSCMKTPLWLARNTGMTGNRNPHETAKEIADRTSEFVRNVLNKLEMKQKIA